jgi:uncharacterized protein YndB with AHSA1/START domain
MVFQAFIDPDALVVWQAPGEMTARVHEFDGRVGGGYRMSLYYPASEPDSRGKSGAREDRYTAQFVELVAPEKIVEAISFESADPTFAGETTMIVTFEEKGAGTEVTIVFEKLPIGIRPEDNDLGTRLALDKLAQYVERRCR